MCGWTDDRIATLKKLWLQGLSATQIAKQLKNVTRNAVVGKAHRMGLPARKGESRNTASAPRAIRAPAVKREPHAANGHNFGKSKRALGVAGNGMAFDRGEAKPPREMVTMTGAVEGSLGLRIIDCGAGGLSGCKWPINTPAAGQGDETRFCCRPRAEASVYCPEHRRRAYAGGTYVDGRKIPTASELARSVRKYA